MSFLEDPSYPAVPPSFRHSKARVADEEVLPPLSGRPKSAKKIPLKTPLRPEGTFGRQKIEYCSGKTSAGKMVVRESQTICYASRADRKSLRLMGIAVMTMLLLLAMILFGPGGKYSRSRRLGAEIARVQDSTKGVLDYDPIQSQGLERKMQEEREAKMREASQPASEEASDGELEISSRDQQALMNEEMSRAQSSRQASEEASSTEARETAPSATPSAWEEPARIGNESLPARMYDNLGYPQVAVAIKNDIPSTR
jgi:hypothetical protein